MTFNKKTFFIFFSILDVCISLMKKIRIHDILNYRETIFNRTLNHLNYGGHYYD
jgi:hypothetical protein